MKAFLLGTVSAILVTTMVSAQPAPIRPGTPSTPARTLPDPSTSTSPATPSTVNPSMVSAVNAAGWMTNEKAGEWRASKLKGVAAYNNNNEKIGDIEELIIGASGKVDAVVIGVGGFLGMGEHQVAVPFTDLQFMDRNHRDMGQRMTGSGTNAIGSTTTVPSSTPMATSSTTSTTGTASTAYNTSAGKGAEAYPERVVLNMTRDQLKAAPAFRYAR